MSIFLPYDKVTIKVRSTPEEVQQKLLDYIEPQSLEVIDAPDSYFLATNKPFKGIVDEYGFHAVTTSHKHNDPIQGLVRLVEARGKFHQDGDYTVVRIALIPNPIIIFSFLIMWVLLNFFFDPPSILGFTISTIIMSIPYIILVVIFRMNAPLIKSRLSKLLKAC